MAWCRGRRWVRRVGLGMTVLTFGFWWACPSACGWDLWNPDDLPAPVPSVGEPATLSREWSSTVFGTNGEMRTMLDTDWSPGPIPGISYKWSAMDSFGASGALWIAEELGLGPFNVTIGPVVDMRVYNLRAAISIGLEAFHENVGLDVSYRIDHNSRYPQANKFRPGDTVHITSSWGPDTSASSIASGDVEGTPRLGLDIEGSLFLEPSIDYFFGSWSPGSIDFDGDLALSMVAPASAGSIQIHPGISGTWTWLRIYDWRKSFEPSGTMRRYGEDAPVQLTADLDEVLMDYYKRHPPQKVARDPKKLKMWNKIMQQLQGLKLHKSAGPASLTVELADLDAVWSLIGHHTTTLTPELRVRYDFSSPVLWDGVPVTYVEQPARCDLCVALPRDQEDPVTVTPSFYLQATLDQEFQVDLAADIIAGIAYASFRINPITIWHGGCVWLVVDEVCIPDFDIPGWDATLSWLYHRKFRVATFPWITESAAPITWEEEWIRLADGEFELDPQVPPEPRFAGMPYVVEEGSTIELVGFRLDGTASTDKDGDDILCWWDLDYDKTFETGPNPTPVFDTRDVGGTGLMLDGPAEQWVTLASCDRYGYRTAETKVTVLNVAPTIDPLDGGSVAEGVRPDDTPTHYVEEGAFSDPGAELEEYLATVDYGDGTGTVVLPLRCDADSYPRHFTLDHIYADNGVYTVTVWVADDDGGEDTVTCTVTVSNQDPTVVAGANQDVAEGEIVELDPATFHDFGTLDTHVAAVHWGDDAPTDVGVVTESPFGPPGSTAGLHGIVDMSHVYQMPTAHFIGAYGDYTVTVTVTDDDGGVGDDTLTVRVHDVKPPELSWVERPEWADNDPEPCFTWAGVDEHTLPEDLVYSTRFNGGGWSAYGSDVSICLGPLVEGWYTLEVRGMDLAGNVSEILRWEWLVDLTPPQVTVSVPRALGQYALGSEVIVQWRCFDRGAFPSSVARVEATALSGEPLDTSVAGRFPFVVEVWDSAGNRARAACDYLVIYLLSPGQAVGHDAAADDLAAMLASMPRVTEGGGAAASEPVAVYEVGADIEIAFALYDSLGEPIEDAEVEATLCGIGDGDPPTTHLLGLWPVPYDAERGLYAVTIPTVMLAGRELLGRYEIWIALGDGTHLRLPIRIVAGAEATGGAITITYRSQGIGEGSA